MCLWIVNNEIGTIEPISESLLKLLIVTVPCIPYRCSAGQGHIAINVKDLGVDMSASAHKFNGPKGIDFIYIKSGTKIFLHADGGATGTWHESGTENIAPSLVWLQH